MFVYTACTEYTAPGDYLPVDYERLPRWPLLSTNIYKSTVIKESYQQIVWLFKECSCIVPLSSQGRGREMVGREAGSASRGGSRRPPRAVPGAGGAGRLSRESRKAPTSQGQPFPWLFEGPQVSLSCFSCPDIRPEPASLVEMRAGWRSCWLGWASAERAVPLCPLQARGKRLLSASERGAVALLSPCFECAEWLLRAGVVTRASR